MTLHISMTLIILTTHTFMSLYLDCNMVCNMVCKISCTSNPFVPHFWSKRGSKWPFSGISIQYSSKSANLYSRVCNNYTWPHPLLDNAWMRERSSRITFTELQFIVWPLIINGFGNCYVKCSCVLFC